MLKSSPKMLAYWAEYRKKNRELLREKNQKYYEKNKVKITDHRKEWVKKNPKRAKFSHQHNFYRRAFGYPPTDITSEYLQHLWEETTHCILCGKKMEESGKYPDGKHLDHIISVFSGGKHMKDNVRYICAKCNLTRPKFEKE